MAVNTSRSMNRNLAHGAVDHTVRLSTGQDRGGVVDLANYYNHIVGSQATLEPGDFLVPGYLAGIVRFPHI